MEFLIIRIIVLILLTWCLSRTSQYTSILQQQVESYPSGCSMENRAYPSGNIPAYGYLMKNPHEEAQLLRRFVENGNPDTLN